jgi:hypothetical protein
MSQFYAEIQGNRGPATRMGSKQSGIRCHIRGWDTGVEVSGVHPGSDVFNIYMTHGSNNSGSRTYLGRIENTSEGPKFFPAADDD